MKVILWIVGHFTAVYTLVMTVVHAVEGAASEAADKRQAAIDQIVTSLESLGMPSGAGKLAGWILGGMIDVYVGVMNALHGHNWYGTNTATVSPQTVTGAAKPAPTGLDGTDQAAAAKVASDNTLTQATQQIRNADGTGPATPTKANQ